jgi:hypothetical protein
MMLDFPHCAIVTAKSLLRPRHTTTDEAGDFAGASARQTQNGEGSHRGGNALHWTMNFAFSTVRKNLWDQFCPSPIVHHYITSRSSFGSLARADLADQLYIRAESFTEPQVCPGLASSQMRCRLKLKNCLRPASIRLRYIAD